MTRTVSPAADDARRFPCPQPGRPIRITVPGPFPMSHQAQNDVHADPAERAMDHAEAVKAEIRDRFAAGADVVQIDEPSVQARPEPGRAHGAAALNRALDGVQGETAVRICFGHAAIVRHRPEGCSFLPEFARIPVDGLSGETAPSPLEASVPTVPPTRKIVLGVLDLSDITVEGPETLAARIRRALPYVPAVRLVIAPDCGMAFLPRDVAFGRMKAMVDDAAIVRAEMSRDDGGAAPGPACGGASPGIFEDRRRCAPVRGI